VLLVLNEWFKTLKLETVSDLGRRESVNRYCWMYVLC